MFDKVVTPSDVGKLNRLVIPKQHAEKYFPLDSSTNEKGLLLNFEDRSGKQWRFRYSYWNSSQSYVMTKGWSRFVKEKRLDAGDIVSFQRGVGEFGRDRLFIDWRRRPDGPLSSSSDQYHHHHLLPRSAAAGTDLSLPHHHHQYLSGFQRSSNILHPATAAWNPLFLQQQQLQQQQQPLMSSSSSATQYYPQPQPHYYRDQYTSTSHLLLPPADHSQNSTTTTSRHHPQSNFHHPNNYTRSTNYNSATYHRHQVTNPASAAATTCSGSVIYFRSAAATHQHQHQHQQEAEEVGMVQVQRPGGDIGAEPTVVFESVPVVQVKAAAKRLRLFGVNMDCPVNISDSLNSADDIIVECDNDNNNRNNTLYSPSATTITELGVSLAPHHYTSYNTYYSYNSPSTATTILPPPYSTSSSSSSSIPYLQLSPYPTATTVNLPDMLNKGKSTMSFDLDI